MKRIGAAISGTIVIAISGVASYFAIVALDDLINHSGPYDILGWGRLVFVLPLVLSGILALKPYLGVIRNKKYPDMHLILLRGFTIVAAVFMFLGACVVNSFLLIAAAVAYFHFAWVIKDFHTSTDEPEEVGK